MPKISDHHSKEAVKMLLLGDSGAGKTASLLSLAQAGYNLRIFDFDNGLDIIRHLIKSSKDPEKVANHIYFKTFTDEMKTTKSGDVIPKGEPKAYANAVKTLNHWVEDDGTDLGNVSDWGPNDVLVIDSLTFLSNAVMRWHLFQVGRIGGPWPADWLEAQRRVLRLLELVFSSSLKCNVVMTAHIRYVEFGEETQGYPESVGKALPPQVPRYFNTVVQAKLTGSGRATKRKIRVVPDTGIGLKNAAPEALSKSELDLESGLAEIFNAIKGA